MIFFNNMVNIKKMCNAYSLIIFLLLIFCYSSSYSALKYVSIVSKSSGLDSWEGYQGKTVEFDVRVDNASMVAGAAFTVTWDTTNITLVNISSDFFETFSKQGISPVHVTVDGKTYYSPFASKNMPQGCMVAGARKRNGTGTNIPLFTLKFLLNGATGSYPIQVIQSKISNTNAGYSQLGQPVPFFVGTDATSFISHSATIYPGTIRLYSNSDTDADGLPDAWEMLHFGNLTTANATTDWDGDGYSDLTEFLNKQEGLTDPSGRQYDPRSQNTPGGKGYVNNDMDFWDIMIPVIINSAKHAQQE